jgi:hypothetical protein
MLAETIMQVLPNSPLFSRTYVQDRLFQVLSFRDVYTCGNDVLGSFSIAWKWRTRPGNEALVSMAREPTGLIVVRKKIRTQHFKQCPEAIFLFRREKQVPDHNCPVRSQTESAG